MIIGGRGNKPDGPEWRRRLSPAGVEYLRRYRKMRWILVISVIVSFILALPAVKANLNYQLGAALITVYLVWGIVAIRYLFRIGDETSARFGVPRRSARWFLDVRSPEQFDASIAKMQAKMRERGIPAQSVGGDSDGPVARLGYRSLLATAGSVSVLLSGVAGALLGPPATGWGLNLCRAGSSLPCFGAGLGVLGVISTVLALLTATIAFRLPAARTGGLSNNPAGPDWRHRLGAEGATTLARYRTILRAGAIVCVAYLVALALLLVVPGAFHPTTVVILTVVCAVALVAVYVLGYVSLRKICAHVAGENGIPAAAVRRRLDLTHPARYDASLAKTHPGH